MPLKLFSGFKGIEAAGFLAKAIPIVFWVVLGFFVLFGFILDFHWRKYSYNTAALLLFRIFYFGGGILLLVVLSLSLESF